MSPIEQRFCAAFLASIPLRFQVHQAIGEYLYESGEGETCCWLESNVARGSYRLDFLLTDGGEKWGLAIECDGHDFHDRIKQQAAYDRARDREMLLQGIFTIRFTGSEIHHSPERCAAEAWAAYTKLYDVSCEPEVAYMHGCRFAERTRASVDESEIEEHW